MKPDRDVRPFQDVLLDLGARLGLPGMVTSDGAPKFPGGYPDYIVNHERRPGIGPLAGFRGPNGDEYGARRAQPAPARRLHGAGVLPSAPPAGRTCATSSTPTATTSTGRWTRASGSTTTPVIFQLYSEPMQKFRLAAQGHGAVQPPEGHRQRIATYFDPLPIWYAPFEERATDRASFPLHAITQRPMAMYHSWGSQNAWLRQIHGANRLYMNRAPRGRARHRRRRLGVDHRAASAA